MDRRLSTWALLSLVLSGVGALTVDIPKSEYEYARGDNITLPCSFTPKPTSKPLGLVVVSWSAEAAKADAKENLILTYYSAGQLTDISSKYEGRASLDIDVAKGKANLKLSKISLDDNKVFECRVQIPGDDEGKPADTARVVVLVAPSTPICKTEGKVEYGQNIKLTCVSEEGSPPPTYSWESRDVRNMPRVSDPRTTDQGGVLSLFNISKDTSGYYTCTSRNKIRSATCNITLSVMPPSMNIGSTAGIIGGVVAALIILIIVIYCCCCRKKKKEEEKYAMGVREEEYTDKEPDRNGESRHADGQEDVERYEDSDVRRPGDRSDHYEERSDYENRRDYDDRHSDYDDRRRDYDDRRERYSDRNERYDDDRNDDRRNDDHYDDRRNDDHYDDRRNDDHYDDRRNDDRYDDRRNDDRYDDRRNDDRYDEPYDDRDRPRVPANKPPRRDYED